MKHDTGRSKHDLGMLNQIRPNASMLQAGAPAVSKSSPSNLILRSPGLGPETNLGFGRPWELPSSFPYGSSLTDSSSCVHFLDEATPSQISFYSHEPVQVDLRRLPQTHLGKRVTEQRESLVVYRTALLAKSTMSRGDMDDADKKFHVCICVLRCSHHQQWPRRPPPRAPQLAAHQGTSSG